MVINCQVNVHKNVFYKKQILDDLFFTNMNRHIINKKFFK